MNSLHCVKKENTLDLIFHPQQCTVKEFLSDPKRYELYVKKLTHHHRILYKSDHQVHYVVKYEPNTSTNTICDIHNIRVIKYTNNTQYVKEFHYSFKLLDNIPVVHTSTSFVRKIRCVYILVINEDWYVGNSMYHSLVNPNQIIPPVISVSYEL